MKRLKAMPLIKTKWDHESLFRLKPVAIVTVSCNTKFAFGRAEVWREQDSEVRRVLDGYGKVCRMGDKWLASERESPYDLRGVEVQMLGDRLWTARRLDRDGHVVAQAQGSSPLRAVGRLPCR